MESQAVALIGPAVAVSLLLAWHSRDGRSGAGARTTALVAVGVDFAIVLDAASLPPTARLIGGAACVTALVGLFEGGRDLVEDVDWDRFARDFAEYVARMDVDEGRR